MNIIALEQTNKNTEYGIKHGIKFTKVIFFFFLKKDSATDFKQDISQKEFCYISKYT